MKKIFVSLVMVISTGFVAFSQTTETANEKPKTLFEYPVAPDTISSFENRANYIVQRFWDNYDLSKPIKDDALFDKAFRDYITFFKYAHRTVVVTSIRHFMFKAQSNIRNFEKIAAIADYALYQPSAEYWSDDVYIEFADIASKVKALKPQLREYYAKQVAILKNSLEGASLASFEYFNLDGKKVKIGDLPEAEAYFIYFDTPDKSFERIRLTTDAGLNGLLESKRIVFLNISVTKFSKEWARDAVEISDLWNVGALPDADMKIDLRTNPCFMFLDKDKKIVQKNVSVETVKSMF